MLVPVWGVPDWYSKDFRKHDFMSGSAQTSLSTEEGHPTSPSRNSICPISGRISSTWTFKKSSEASLWNVCPPFLGHKSWKQKTSQHLPAHTKRMESAAATDKDWHVFLELLIWIRMPFNVLLNFLNFCLDDKNMTHNPILLLKIFFSILPETWKHFEMWKICFLFPGILWLQERLLPGHLSYWARKFHRAEPSAQSAQVVESFCCPTFSPCIVAPFFKGMVSCFTKPSPFFRFIDISNRFTDVYIYGHFLKDQGASFVGFLFVSKKSLSFWNQWRHLELCAMDWVYQTLRSWDLSQRRYEQRSFRGDLGVAPSL